MLTVQVAGLCSLSSSADGATFASAGGAPVQPKWIMTEMANIGKGPKGIKWPAARNWYNWAIHVFQLINESANQLINQLITEMNNILIN